jgi:hypothetical protein
VFCRSPLPHCQVFVLERFKVSPVPRIGGRAAASALALDDGAALFLSSPAPGPLGLATVYSRAGSNRGNESPRGQLFALARQRRPLWREHSAGSGTFRRFDSCQAHVPWLTGIERCWRERFTFRTRPAPTAAFPRAGRCPIGVDVARRADRRLPEKLLDGLQVSVRSVIRERWPRRRSPPPGLRDFAGCRSAPPRSAGCWRP